MPETAKTISIAQLEIPATSNPTNVLERKATQCLYLIDSAIEAPCSFLDIDVEPFADFIEHAEAQPRSVRLVMANHQTVLVTF